MTRSTIEDFRSFSGLIILTVITVIVFLRPMYAFVWWLWMDLPTLSTPSFWVIQIALGGLFWFLFSGAYVVWSLTGVFGEPKW